jgi:hypothetical protein
MKKSVFYRAIDCRPLKKAFFIGRLTVVHENKKLAQRSSLRFTPTDLKK